MTLALEKRIKQLEADVLRIKRAISLAPKFKTGQKKVGFKLHVDFKDILNNRSLGRSQSDVVTRAMNCFNKVHKDGRKERLEYHERTDLCHIVVNLPDSVQKKINKLAKANYLFNYEVIQMALTDLNKSNGVADSE